MTLSIAGLDTPSLVGWILIFGVGVVWEFKGILSPTKGDTLSETVWRLLRTAKIWRYLLAGFLIWLLVHFLTFGRFG